MCHFHTHTHTHTYIYIYIYKRRRLHALLYKILFVEVKPFFKVRFEQQLHSAATSGAFTISNAVAYDYYSGQYNYKYKF